MNAIIELDEKLQQRAQWLADAQQRPLHGLLQDAIVYYIEQEEKRQSFYEDAQRAWSAWQRDGLHLTEAEADDWLARLAWGEDAEIPPCHNGCG